jgi:hypothetical protein
MSSREEIIFWYGLIGDKKWDVVGLGFRAWALHGCGRCCTPNQKQIHINFTITEKNLLPKARRQIYKFRNHHGILHLENIQSCRGSDTHKSSSKVHVDKEIAPQIRPECSLETLRGDLAI